MIHLEDLEDDALRLKHIATVNNTNILVVLTVFASFYRIFCCFLYPPYIRQESCDYYVQEIWNL
jgi:hypothetical protein